MRKTLLWVGQGVLVVVVALFVGRALAKNWAEFRAVELQLDVQPGWIVLAAATVWVTYAVLIEAWRRIVGGWDERPGFATAARIWCVSNLGRYLPGKIWGVVGLAVLARKAGVSAWAAAGSALAMQAFAVGTGASIVVATAPGTLSLMSLAVAIALAVAIVIAVTSSWGAALASRISNTGTPVRALPVPTSVVAILITAVSWVAYGVAFWLLARGLLPGPVPALVTLTGVFAAGYVAGFLALFAPGGIGVREVVFVAMLAPLVGGGGAIALSVASRLLLTLTELVAAVLAGLLGSRAQEGVVDAP